MRFYIELKLSESNLECPTLVETALCFCRHGIQAEVTMTNRTIQEFQNTRAVLLHLKMKERKYIDMLASCNGVYGTAIKQSSTTETPNP